MISPHDSKRITQDQIAALPHAYQGDDRIARVLSDRERLPKFLRPLHRVLTAVPDLNATVPQLSPWGVFVRDLGLLAGFAAAAGLGATLLCSSSLAGATGGAVLAAYGMLGVVGRLRRLVVGHNHEACHFAVRRWYMDRGWSKPNAGRASEAIIDIATALTLTINGQDYRRAHNRHHMLGMLGTLQDPDGKSLQDWGFWGDMKPGEFPRRLLLTIFSPRWHARFLLDRARSNLLKGKPYRRLAGLVAMLALLASALVMPIAAWIAAIALPWTWGYQTASLLQVLTRHNYPHRNGAKSLPEYTARTWERIPWTPMPEAGLGKTAFLRTWSIWLAELLLVHVPSRLTVLDSSMIWHGFHHTAYLSGVPFNDWWNSEYRAMVARRDGVMAAEGASQVLWGLPEALGRQARRMESPLE